MATKRTIQEVLDAEFGGDILVMAEQIIMEKRHAPALCSENCEVEPDGMCIHGFESILKASGFI
jgi:hypothetical protein